MTQIKCIENFLELRHLFRKGVTGDINFFTDRLTISNRTFFRLIDLLKKHEGMDIIYSRSTNRYYIKE
jgi:hypothetical protein